MTLFVPEGLSSVSIFTTKSTVCVLPSLLLSIKSWGLVLDPYFFSTFTDTIDRCSMHDTSEVKHESSNNEQQMSNYAGIIVIFYVSKIAALYLQFFCLLTCIIDMINKTSPEHPRRFKIHANLRKMSSPIDASLLDVAIPPFPSLAELM